MVNTLQKQHSNTQTSEGKIWFAMRATYGQEISAQKILDSLSIETFIPMVYKVTTIGGIKTTKSVPALGNYIFVYGTQREVYNAKQKIPYLRYVMSHSKSKITIPTEQMDNFIKVAKANDKSAQYFTPDQLNLKEATPIRIHGGQFDGTECLLLKLEGRRNKRLVVQLPNLLAITITTPPLVELIKE